MFHPNIAASRGTPENNTAGGQLTNSRINTDISFEYNRPKTRSTFGVLVSNVFSNSTGPRLNARYQASRDRHQRSA